MKLNTQSAPYRNEPWRPFVTGPYIPNAVVNWYGKHAGGLVHHLRGAPVFLVCGGNSLNEVDLSQLYRRGIVTACVNQSAATHVRPRFAFFGDPPRKFHPAIWNDAGITKFVKRDDSQCRVTLEWGPVGGGWAVTKAGEMVRHYPNVWFWERGYGFEPQNFLHLPRISWGKDFGKRSTRNVMFPALRLLYWMGCRTVYLIGADFHMKPQDSYAFDEPKDARAAGTNNNTYGLLNRCFHEMRPHFAAADFRVFNCTPNSRLDAFPAIDYNAAIASVTAGIPPVETVRGLYKL